MVWRNPDGLVVFYPTDSRTVEAGEYQGAGANRVIEFEYTLAGGSTSAGSPTPIAAPWLIIPRNSRIDKVEVVAEVAATGGTSINFGLQRLDGVTAIDYSGLVAGMLTAAIDTQGETSLLTKGSTGAGALVGTTTAYPGTVVAYAAGTYTAGKLVVRVHIYVPGKDLVKQY